MHLKVIMVVDEDDEEEDTHICPIMYAELLSGGILFFQLPWGKAKLGHSRYPVMWTIRGVEWKLIKTNLDEFKNW